MTQMELVDADFSFLCYSPSPDSSGNPFAAGVDAKDLERVAGLASDIIKY